MAKKILEQSGLAYSAVPAGQQQFAKRRQPAGHSASGRLLALQSIAGNRAVGQLLRDTRFQATTSTGRPIDTALRIRMEARFGQNFNQVRLHTGEAAAISAQLVNARAYSTGENVVYSGSEFAPETLAGQRLLAHELAHVVQQRQAPGKRSPQAAEQEAKQAAETGRLPYWSGGDKQGSGEEQILGRRGAADGLIQRQPYTKHEIDQLSLEQVEQRLTANESEAQLQFYSLEYYDQLQVEHIALLEAWNNKSRGRSDSGAFTAAANDFQIGPGQEETSSGQPPLNILLVDPSATTRGFALLGQYSPLARPPTAQEWAVLRAGKALHYTPAGNIPAITETEGIVNLNPSQGIYRNLLTPRLKPSTYFFLGQPNSTQQALNIAGRGSLSSQGVVIVQGSDLPPNTLIRPLDKTIVIPGGYTGQGAAVEPGGQIPLPLKLPPATSALEESAALKTATPRPVGGLPSSAAAAVGLGLGLATSYIHHKAVEHIRDTEGYAPVGPAAYAGEGLLSRLGRLLQDPTLDTQADPESRFNVHVWRANIRQHAGDKPVGSTFSINWQSFGSDRTFQTVDDVPVTYEKQPDGTWKAHPPKEAPNGFVIPDLNKILDPNVSDMVIKSYLQATSEA